MNIYVVSFVVYKLTVLVCLLQSSVTMPLRVGSETSCLKASKAKSCSSVNKTEVEVSGQTGHDSSLLEILKKQQEQLDKLSSMIQGLKQPKYRGKWKDGTNDMGERVCFKCHQPGHLIKDCPQRQNANNAQSSEKPKGLN